MTLQFRRMYLSTNYWINLQGHEQNSPTECLLNHWWGKRKEENKKLRVDSNREGQRVQGTPTKCEPNSAAITNSTKRKGCFNSARGKIITEGLNNT